jgi:hypothetical protein
MRKLHKDNRAILGLPLQMLVMVIIAAIAIGLIAMWMIGGQNLASIAIKSPPQIQTEGDISGQQQGYLNDDANYASLEIRAYDDDGDPLPGVTVKIEGCSLDFSKTTNSDGIAEFSLNGQSTDPTDPEYFEIPGTDNTGTITVTATYEGSGPLSTPNTVKLTITVNEVSGTLP